MDRTLCLIFGNGLTIDLLSHLKLRDRVDVTNLFRYGAEVPWPATGEPGFLSFKHCPNLWNLGARPHMETQDCLALIEDIITCANAFASKAPDKRNLAKSASKAPNEIYINAFKELSLYLKYLFVYYDSIVAGELHRARDWAWMEFIRSAAVGSHFSKIEIITFNYDPWLERLMLKEGLAFSIAPCSGGVGAGKICVAKPHGSISFCHKTKLEKASFSINYEKTLIDGEFKDFDIAYDNLDENYLVTPLIPPAGEAKRFNQTWAGEVRGYAEQVAKGLTADDEMVICGLSYWHVDRAELDALLNASSSSINIKMINPSPSRTLTAVITSIFDRFICYPSNAVLKNILK